jgi:hypothetical protein
MTYKVKIVETMELVVEVEAESGTEAVEKVEQAYINEEHVLDWNNHTDTEFRLEE